MRKLVIQSSWPSIGVNAILFRTSAFHEHLLLTKLSRRRARIRFRRCRSLALQFMPPPPPPPPSALFNFNFTSSWRFGGGRSTFLSRNTATNKDRGGEWNGQSQNARLLPTRKPSVAITVLNDEANAARRDDDDDPYAYVLSNAICGRVWKPERVRQLYELAKSWI